MTTTFVKGAREDLIRALINMWLKMPQKSCVRCGADYYEGMEACCEAPCPMTNYHQMQIFCEERREITQSRLNAYGSTENKTLRFGLSIPEGLYHYLNGYFQQHYNESLINDDYNIDWLVKRFPVFRVPEVY